jgi:hypothetical protein
MCPTREIHILCNDLLLGFSDQIILTPDPLSLLPLDYHYSEALRSHCAPTHTSLVGLG